MGYNARCVESGTNFLEETRGEQYSHAHIANTRDETGSTLLEKAAAEARDRTRGCVDRDG